MKIAFVYDAVYPFSKGGGERRIYEIATRLSQRGHEVHIFGMKQWEGGRNIQKDGLHYHGLCGSLELYHSSGRRSIREAILFGLYSMRLLGSEKFDIVDCGQWPYFHLLPVRLYAWLRSVKMVVSWYEVWGSHWYKYLGAFGAFGLAVEKLFCRIPDKLIAVSEMTRCDLLTLGVRSDRVIMVANGIDYAHIRSIQAVEERRYDVVCTGRLKNHKNVEVLLRAIAIAKQALPNISVLIIGEGPERADLERLTQELGLTENVTFTGGLADFDDVLRLMKSARLFVNASTKEGGGSITLFEANACGLPVIAVRSPCGIDPSLIIEGKNGYMVDDLNGNLISDKIVELLQNPDLLRHNSEAAIVSAAQFDWQEITNLHEKIYLNVCGISQA
ncbi:MAG: glycosyltransferase family 4 protein [Formivibrio sp.]|nr:glycosyltransferase family 4 protein [Formivibrio sp.]